MKCRIIAFACLMNALTAAAQQPIINKPDSLNEKMDSTVGQVNNSDPHVYDAQTRITPGNYVSLLISDLKQEFTKPFHMQPRDWGNLAKYAAVGGALAFFDGPIQRGATSLIRRNPGAKKFSKTVTDFGGPYEALALAAFGGYGLAFKNEKMKTTTLLATRAYITGAALVSVVKVLTGRTRPSFYTDDVRATATFLGPFSSKAGKDNSSFPSGHTTVAFAVATVFALEYSNKPWVPIVAYSSATLVGLSRISENKHWATDVFAGAVVGFLAGRIVVKNYHRFAKLKADERKKAKPVSFHFQYNNGQLMPGLTWYF